MTLLDARGNPISSAKPEVQALSSQMMTYLKTKASNYKLQVEREIKAKYDAAQTSTGNEGHWQWADFLDPNSAASPEVRRTLRARSRYEIIENNPYLQGTIISLCNDFAGKGPKLSIVDDRIDKAAKEEIELRWWEWSRVAKIRRLLWSLRLSKISDGEGFAMAYLNKSRYPKYPLKLDYYWFEAELCASPHGMDPSTLPDGQGEVDGVRFDAYGNKLRYYIQEQYPSSPFYFMKNWNVEKQGKWIDQQYILHWFRRLRPWIRGVPELTPSLPLCALLRRYTLSMVQHAEIIANFTALIETEAPAGLEYFEDFQAVVDSIFDEFPVTKGMVTALPAGYVAKQLEAVPLGAQYDQFVGSVLREICRPLLTPWNLVSGTSKDSNMASGVLDHTIYRDGQKYERTDCEEEVLERLFLTWWEEALIRPDYFKKVRVNDDFLRNFGPMKTWRWDRISIDHTDPDKVQKAIQTGLDSGYYTMKDIQEEYHGRDIDEWQEDYTEYKEFMKQFEPEPAPVAGPAGSAPKKKSAVKKAAPKKAVKR